MTNQIIKQFHDIEVASNNHCEDYLEVISEQTSIKELIDEVAMWINVCEGDKYKASIYILETLDKAK